MAEKIIEIANAEVKSSESGSEYIILTDTQGKAHRVFPSVQRDNGEWVHLEGEIDMLKAMIKNGTIIHQYIKLNKEQKGKWWNVTAVALTEHLAEGTVVNKEDTGEDQLSPHLHPDIAPQEAGMWFKEVGEWLRAGKLPTKDERGKDIPLNIAIKTAYWARMFIVLGITETTKKEP